MHDYELFGRRYRSPVPLPSGYWLAPALALAIVVGVFVRPKPGAGGDPDASDPAVAQRRLEEAVAEARRTDPDPRLGAILAARDPIPDERNAALRVDAAARLLPVDEARDRVGDVLDATPSGDPLPADRTAELRRRLDALEPVLAEARTLADLDEGRFDVPQAGPSEPAPIAHLDRARRVADLLALDAALRAEDGRVDDALASWRAMLNAGRAIGDEPRLVPQLSRMRMNLRALRLLPRLLARGEASDAELSRVQAALAAELKQPWLILGLRGERRWILERSEALRRGEARTTIAGRAGPHAADDADPSPARLAADLQCLNDALAVARRPTEQQQAAWSSPIYETDLHGRLSARPSDARDDSPTVTLALAGKIALQTRAALASAVLAVALERHRLAHGSWPDSLRAIDPSILTEQPADPYSRGSVRLVRDGSGVVAYSIGPDRRNDSGRIDEPSRDRLGRDLGLRLLDPAARRAAGHGG